MNLLSMALYSNINMEKRRDDWTLFVRSIRGETLTLSNMKASSRGRELYSMLRAITGIPKYNDASHDRYNNPEATCFTFRIWFGEWVYY